MQTLNQDRWFFYVTKDTRDYFHTLECALISGSPQRDGEFYGQAEFSLTWQRNSDQPERGWYGFQVKLDMGTNNMPRIERAFDLLRKINKAICKIEGRIASEDGFGFGTKPTRIREALHKIGVPQIVRDPRMGCGYVELDKIQAPWLRQYAPDTDDRWYNCDVVVWADSPTEAQIKIAATWAGNLQNCKGCNGYCQPECSANFMRWTQRGMPVRALGSGGLPEIITLDAEDEQEEEAKAANEALSEEH